jgi:hypothetical protein
MDERTLVPAMLPIVQLDGHSTIPTNLPLDSIATRVVVPRDVNREAYNVTEDHSTPAQPTDMDERIVLPAGSAAPEMSSYPLHVPEDLVDPNIFITGEVNLTVPEHKEERSKARWQVTMRLLLAYSLLITLILLQSKLFPPHEPTQADMELARRQMVTLLPPGTLESLKPSPRPAGPPPPRVHVDPRVLREVAPPVIPTPAPAPQPERPVKELPSAPVPKQSVVPPDTQQPLKLDAPKPALRLEAPDTPQPNAKLQLPSDHSPGQNIQDILKGTRPSGPRPIGGGGQLPGGGGRGGGGSGTAYGGIEMLTPDEGVDFNSYLQRVYVTVKRNWFSVMPGSVELGEKGIVYLTFRINRDGSVPSDEPIIERNSGKEPLDRAAFSSVRASNPFEPLPSQFKGPYIELRYRYYYNILPNASN